MLSLPLPCFEKKYANQRIFVLHGREIESGKLYQVVLPKGVKDEGVHRSIYYCERF